MLDFLKKSGNDDCRSRLAKNLQDILSDKSCLSYFTQFLDKKNALKFLKFYLDCESFAITADLLILRRTKHSNEKLKKKIKSNCDLRFEQKIPSPLFRSTSLDGYNILPLNRNKMCHKLSRSLENNLLDVHIFNSCELNSNKNTIQLHWNTRKHTKSCLDSLLKTTVTSAENKIRTNIGKLNKGNIKDTKILCAAGRMYTNDVIYIYKKYFTRSSPDFISIPHTIFMNISLALCNLEDDGSTAVSLNCFADAKKYIMNELEKNYLNDFLESSFYCQYCVNILTSSSLSVTDILYSESALFYFMEYLEQQSKSCYLQFWVAASNYQRHYKSRFDYKVSNHEAQNDAMVLYDKYISLQAPYPLKISDNVRSGIEECICANNETMIYCFDLPLRIIEGYFNKYHFKGFISSSLFEKYLRELRVKLEENNNHIFSTNSASSSRNTKSMTNSLLQNKKDLPKTFASQKNTLLAMESKVTNFLNHDIKIDSKQLTNPDLLWQRNKSSSSALTFGRVDSLGRYERNFEASSVGNDKWSMTIGSNRLKNAVRKLAKLPEDHLQEEIAWQVAEMIIKDVTNITLGSISSVHGSLN